MKIKIDNIKKSNFNSVADFDFFRRVYQSNINDYSERAKMIGFNNMNRVLDFGCGYGQWSIAFSKFNCEVYASDSSQSRINVFNKIISNNKIDNIYTKSGKINELNFQSNFFDGIFLYNVINLMDYKMTLRILKDLLNDKGILYFNYYDLGWILHNIINEHNPSEDFSPRKWGLEAIYHTINYNLNDEFISTNGKDTLYIETHLLNKYLKEVGFKVIHFGGDGEININGNKTVPFFPKESYGLNAVCEFLLVKE